MAEKTGQFRTADLYFAAFLKVACVVFLDHVRDEDENRVYFIFEDPQDGTLRNLRNSYFARKAPVDALTHSQEIQALKSLTHM